jgi:predicted MFS family arabinose efflux permease
MTLQVMCEPGIFSLLMDRVKPDERVGASGLNSVTMFGAQALAATGAGWAFVHFGYQATLSAAAGLALLSAWLFRRLRD